MVKPENLSLNAIGWISSCYKECFGTPRQGALAPASEAIFTLAPELHSQGYFSGLESFSHIWLLWQFHQSEQTAKSGKVYPPRLGGGKLGVFATRSPHRPNPLGLTLARLVEVGENSLKLSGIDLIEGTPILDLKPYLPEVDEAAGANSGWVENLLAPPLQVHFSQGALDTLAKLALPIPREQFRELIIQSLALDPRPENYKTREKDYYFRLYDWDIGFVWQEGLFLVNEIRSI